MNNLTELLLSPQADSILVKKDPDDSPCYLFNVVSPWLMGNESEMGAFKVSLLR